MVQIKDDHQRPYLSMDRIYIRADTTRRLGEQRGQVSKQVAQRATIAHLSPTCQGQSAPKPYAAFPPPQ